MEYYALTERKDPHIATAYGTGRHSVKWNKSSLERQMPLDFTQVEAKKAD